MKKPVEEFVKFYSLDDLIAQENAQTLTADDITISRLADETGWNRCHAKSVISEWVKAGKVEYLGKRREPNRGQKVDAWRLKVK